MCKAVYIYVFSEFTDVFQSGLPVIKWHGIVEDDIEGEEATITTTTKVWCLFINLFVLIYN